MTLAIPPGSSVMLRGVTLFERGGTVQWHPTELSAAEVHQRLVHSMQEMHGRLFTSAQMLRAVEAMLEPMLAPPVCDAEVER